MAIEPLVSICVPTCKREAIVRDLLKSIYFKNQEDHSLFEVCITDNSDTDETKELIEKEFSDIDNLHYKKVTCKGFLNSIEALKYGNGKLLKLHNNYSLLRPGALNQIINIAKKYQDKAPVIFFSMDALKRKPRVTEFVSYDDFMNYIHYFSTWSTSFSIWRTDFERILNEGITVDEMFPHTSILFRLTDKELYIVDNEDYVDNIKPKKKGGYNLIDSFVRIFLTMVKQELLDTGCITTETYRKIEKNIIKFCASWFSIAKHNKKMYTFTFDRRNEIIRKQCGRKSVVVFYVYYILYYIKDTIKSPIKYFLSACNK